MRGDGCLIPSVTTALRGCLFVDRTDVQALSNKRGKVYFAFLLPFDPGVGAIWMKTTERLRHNSGSQ